MKTRYKVYLGIMSVVVILSISFGLFGFVNFLKEGKKPREFLCEDGISFKLIDNFMFIRDKVLTCERKNGYILCEVPVEGLDPAMKGYAGLRESDNRLFMLLDIKVELVEDERIKELLKSYGRDKVFEYLCELSEGQVNKELGMCMDKRSYQCKEL